MPFLIGAVFAVTRRGEEPLVVVLGSWGRSAVERRVAAVKGARRLGETT